MPIDWCPTHLRFAPYGDLQITIQIQIQIGEF